MQSLAPKVNLVTAIIGQADTLLRDEIGARYAVEMSKSRDQSNEQIAKQTAQYEMQLRQKQWELLQLEALCSRITGVEIADLRDIAEDLVTVVNRANELKQEIRSRTLLSPSLINAFDSVEQTEETALAKKELQVAIHDLPVLEQHYRTLEKLAFDIAAKFEYREFESDALEISFNNVTRN